MTDRPNAGKERIKNPPQAEAKAEEESHAISEFQPRKEEAYYLANFKAVMENCLLASNPERHVISADEASTFDRFTKLSSTYYLWFVDTHNNTLHTCRMYDMLNA